MDRHFLGGLLMRLIQHSIRIPINLDRALRQLAASREVSQYSVLGECVRIGLATLSSSDKPTQAIPELVREAGAMRAELAHTERLIERSLYTACAAYVYSRVAASGRTDETKLSREITEAFDRQLQLAGDEQ